MPSYLPTLFVDLNTVRTNIQLMAEKCQRNELEFRPHFKTHQSTFIGNLFREAGVAGITVSSPVMAQYFVKQGWDDITIAFPANVNAASVYNELLAKCDLKTLVISTEIVETLDQRLQSPIGLYIEIDPDYGRSGIPASNKTRIVEVIKAIEQAEHCTLAGFYCHAGHTYKCRSAKEITSVSRKALAKLTSLKESFPHIPICYGDTPSCSVLDDFGPYDQLSPGNFVFYDWMQVEIGSCNKEQIAIWMSCPVIEKFSKDGKILIHGGAVHFSKEFVESGQEKIFGKVISDDGQLQGVLASISQEHGIIHCNREYFEQLAVGDTVQVLPVHSCLTANLMGEYRTEDAQTIDHMSAKAF